MQRIKNRGPDFFHKTRLTVDNSTSIHFMGSVLWMQGSEWTPQPVENSAGVLLYNGDIFDDTWDKSLSDSEVIMQQLSKVELVSVTITILTTTILFNVPLDTSVLILLPDYFLHKEGIKLILQPCLE